MFSKQLLIERVKADPAVAFWNLVDGWGEEFQEPGDETALVWAGVGSFPAAQQVEARVPHSGGSQPSCVLKRTGTSS